MSALNSRVMPVAPHIEVPPPSAATDTAGLVAGHPAEAVVAEGQLQDRVVLEPPTYGRIGRRSEHHRRHPPAGCEHDGKAAASS